MKSTYQILLLVFIGCLISCGSARLTEDNIPNSEVDLNTTGLANNLGDLLRKQPGVRVTGSGANLDVLIRGGANSITLNTKPLYVINGVQMGHEYRVANQALDINSVERIEIKKGTSQTNIYGGAGVNGVIEIYTKSYSQGKRKRS